MRKSKLLGATIFLCFLLPAASGHAREVVDATGTRVKVSDTPVRIVTLAPSLGELAADILGEKIDRIVGVSEYTDFPPAVARKKTVGPYSRFNLETVASLKPDLVLGTLDGNPKDQINHLRELGFPVVVVAGGDFAQVEQSMKLVAQALGIPAEGERMASQFSTGIARIRDRATKRAGPKPRVLVQIGDNPLVVVGGRSFIESAVETVGGVNVYADASAHYPRPSLEDAVARDPDVILVLALGKEEAAFRSMAEPWKRFTRMKAVKNSQVKIVPGDTVARPTLRLLEGLSLLEKAIHAH